MREPRFEPRRRAELEAELVNRARAWLPDWRPLDQGDFAKALFAIAARLESEVTQRLDRMPEKTFRGFLDWLGVRGRPGRAARLPVVFTMTPGSEPITAPAPVRIQALGGAAPVMFETERPIRLVPARLVSLTAADPASDAFYRPPAGLLSVGAPAVVPKEWRLKAAATVAATQLQLEPDLGLATGLTLRDPSGQHYRVIAAEGGIVTIEPPFGQVEPKGDADPAPASDLPAGERMTRVDVFEPFAPTERNRQEHALYIGAGDALNIETPAVIALEGAALVPADATWWYSGKRTASSPVEWIEFETKEVAGGRLLLWKPAGAIENFSVGSYSSRWLRATHAPGGFDVPSVTDGVRLLINCDSDSWPESVAQKYKEAYEPAAKVPLSLEGIANTTPLVLDAPFFPLGTEPRQFDSFYLGSKEAFSKPSARVKIHFALGDRIQGPRAVVAFDNERSISVGIGDDGRLHKAVHGVAGDVPTVTFEGPGQPAAADRLPIELTAGVRPGAASLFTAVYFSAASRNEVWLWRRFLLFDTWERLGRPHPEGAPVTETMLTRQSSGIGLVAYAVAEGKLYRRRALATDAWAEENIPLDSGDAIAKVVPVASATALPGVHEEADGVVALTQDGSLFLRAANGAWSDVSAAVALDQKFYPLVIKTSSARLCVARTRSGRHPIAFDLASMGTGFTAAEQLVGEVASFVLRDTDVVPVIIAETAGEPAALAVWDAFNNAAPLFDDAAGQRRLVSGPVLVGKKAAATHFFVPGESPQAHVIAIGQVQFVDNAPLTDAAIFSDPNDWSGETRLLIARAANINDPVIDVKNVVSVGINKWAFVLENATKPKALAESVQVYKAIHASTRNGKKVAAKELELDGQDADAAASKFVSIETDGRRAVIEIAQVNAGMPNKTAVLDSNLPGALNDPIKYQIVEPSALAASLSVTLRPTIGTGDLDASMVNALANLTFEFAQRTPKTQTALHVLAALQKAVLSAPWTTRPPNTLYDYFARLALFGTWQTFEPPRPRNPKLSWEYWDGTSWRQIPGLRDFTEELAKADNVRFCVPVDLKPVDVNGRTNHWIRARLVGGDYGQETVTVVTNTNGNTSTQTVTRSTDSIRAPYVTKLDVSYEVCCAVRPDIVLTRDNGALRDQTDANRSTGALVEYFVPLSLAIRRAAAADSGGDGGRALYLGFDAEITGGPVQLLFLVDEGAHDAAYPLRVDILAGDRFKPLVVKDETRGLNESGTLSLTLAESPQPAELFGESRYWLRLRPGARLADTAEWQPRIQAAYVNATFALAAETQEFERLGSSDGSPAHTVTLSRPPVIDGSLRLRVREPLGDEDVEKLRRQFGDDVVREDLPDLPGRWVRWDEVVDPADHQPMARVYALNDVTGEITFGDGQGGMIPPIGRDSIVAERYQRGGGEAANQVDAWDQLNLITALQGVDRVVAPAGAAGGSDPQDVATTMRFAPANLRLRDRALTGRDLEVLALQFSRDVAQARAIVRGTGTRLIVVMRGSNPRPSAGTLRELRRALLASSLPMLAAPGALEIAGPVPIPVRLRIALTVADVEFSGIVSDDVAAEIAKFLDPAAGNHDGLGWPLGEVPSETDIAAALVGVKRIESLDSIVILHAIDDGALARLRSDQLIQLAPNGVVVDVAVADLEVIG